MSEPSSACKATALWWVARGVHVVPVTPRLADNGKGKLAPRPYAAWEWSDVSAPMPPGRLTTSAGVEAFWAEHPEAQLSIVLGSGLAVVDVDTKNLTDGKPPEGYPIPLPFGDGLAERSKSGGLHLFFRHKVPLPEGTPTRFTGLGGYVDILAGGLLFTAPSVFIAPDGSPGGRCEATSFGPIPEFEGFSIALDKSAPWLATMWKQRRSQPQAAVTGTLPEPSSDDVRVWMGRLMADTACRAVFTEGDRKPDGGVDRSRTEFYIAGWLRRHGCPEDTAWGIIQQCPHAKSNVDKRGQGFFRKEIWAKLGPDNAPVQAAQTPTPPPETAPEHPSWTPADGADGHHIFDALTPWGGYGVSYWPKSALLSTGKKSEPRTDLFADKLLADRRFRTEADTGHVFAYQDGFYNGHAEGYIGAWTELQFRHLNIPLKKAFVSEVVDGIRRLTPTSRERWNPVGKLCLANKVLDLSTLETSPHDPNMLFTYRIPVDFDCDARHDEWDRFLESCVDDPEVRSFLQRAFGYTLRPGNQYQLSFILYGPPNSGKSTALRILAALLGKESVSTEPLQMLSKPFSAAALFGKLANISPDLPRDRVKDTAVFRQLTGEDLVRGERKYEPQFSFENMAKLWFSANQPPKVPHDPAFYRRVVMIPFPHRRRGDEVDFGLFPKLQRELPGILNWSLEGLSRLQSDGRMVIPKVLEDSANVYELQSDTVRRYATEQLVESPGTVLPKPEVYGDYVTWCKDEEVAAEERSDFAEQLPACIKVVSGHRQRNKKEERIWVGIKFRGDGDPPDRGGRTLGDFASRTTEAGELPEQGSEVETTRTTPPQETVVRLDTRLRAREEKGGTPEQLESSPPSRTTETGGAKARDDNPPVDPVSAEAVDAAYATLLDLLGRMGDNISFRPDVIEVVLRQKHPVGAASGAMGRLAGSGLAVQRDGLWYFRAGGPPAKPA
jgi:P4 family phage/plasmid primase-like protien